ncbi:MAG: ATP-binding protein [Bacteroidia bacterium]|nr:ATP-binding protein [Bacteroidia bacterium]
MYERQKYTNKIEYFINTPVIKVITGIRRGGKSYLIRLIINKLKAVGISSNQILYINKESLDFEFIRNYKDLDNHVKDYYTTVSSGEKYIFIDEIQEIAEWEKAIVSLFSSGNYDIYITGSNSRLFSSELATLISGRYVEFQVFTLGFDEFLVFRDRNKESVRDEFNRFLRLGGFPVIHHLAYNEELIFQYIRSIYNTIVLKDIVSKHNIRNVGLFENITRFIADNIGHIISARSINSYLKSQYINAGIETVMNYLGYLSSVYLLHKVSRYDIKGKSFLEIYDKYYLGDIALKSFLTGYKEKDIPGLLENIVFLKLKQSDYEVYIGKYDEYEIDFIAEKSGNRIYFQVCYLLSSAETVEREYKALRKIKDNYPKYVLSMDNLPETNTDGIIRMNIIDFLLK